jgi:hypothetical protein
VKTFESSGESFVRLLPFSHVKSAKAKGASASLAEGEEEEPAAEIVDKGCFTAATFVVDAGSGCVAADDIPARASSSATRRSS